jgi:hypothetical protein
MVDSMPVLSCLVQKKWQVETKEEKKQQEGKERKESNRTIH